MEAPPLPFPREGARPRSTLASYACPSAFLPASMTSFRSSAFALREAAFASLRWATQTLAWKRSLVKTFRVSLQPSIWHEIETSCLLALSFQVRLPSIAWGCASRISASVLRLDLPTALAT